MALFRHDGRARRWGIAGLLLAAVLLLAPAPGSAQDAAKAPAESTIAELQNAQEALEAGHAVPEEHVSGGMPQLNAYTFPSQIFWLIVTFGLLYWLLSTRALPRVGEILEARRDRIEGDLDRAANLRAEAEEALARYEAVLAEAQGKAQAQMRELHERLLADAAKRQAALDAELGQKLKAAEERIAAARERALDEIRDVAAEVAQAATSRLVGVEVSKDEARDVLDRVVAEAA
jgi:F-type H+-transporting ATPase subunit b